MNLIGKFFMVVLLYGTTLQGMEKKDDTVELTDLVNLSPKFENKKIADTILKIFLVTNSEIHPYVVKNIENMETSDPNKYRYLKKFLQISRRNTASKKTNGQVKFLDFTTQKIASKIVALSCNEYAKENERTMLIKKKMRNICLAFTCLEIGFTVCIAAGTLIPSLLSC